MTSRLDRDRLLQDAFDAAGSDDLGEPTWSEGLDRLLASLEGEAELTEIGLEIAANDVVTALSNRAQVTAWRPQVTVTPVERPIVIVGQPRTGTTILYDLLAQDPALRAPLTWEVDRPCPPPVPETYDTDPRIGEVQATIDLAEALMPGFLAFHPIGARLGQECVRITAGDFRSMIFPTQYSVPSYNRWLLHEADLAPAYRYHRRYLEHLQSGLPGQWLLKSPAHLWHLDALAAEYPDALVVQTHRDPLKVIASVSALTHVLRSMASDASTVQRAAAQYAEDILLGLERGMSARDRGVFPTAQVVDVQLADFVADPFATIRGLYARLGRELSAEAEGRMRAFLAAHPGDGGVGRYSWEDTGLEVGPLRERVRGYQERYAVPTEVG